MSKIIRILITFKYCSRIYFYKRSEKYKNLQIKIKKMEITATQQLSIQDQLFIDNQRIMEEHQIKTYESALSFTKLSVPHQIHFRNVKIYEKDHMHQIYTKHQKSAQLPHLVLMHGFGGTSLTFTRIFHLLYDHYQVHALDTFGIGNSSQGNYCSKFTNTQTINYYIDAVEQWRKKLKIKQFTLAGHSFGGYLAIQYALKYPKSVKRLILLSPAGANTPSEEQIQEKERDAPFGRKVFYCIAKKVFDIGIRPSRAMDNFFIGDKMMERVLGGRLQLQGEQKQAWRNYLKNISKYDKRGQQGFYKIFKWPIKPQTTIKQLLKNNQFTYPIQIYYGDNDWMYEKEKGHQLPKQIDFILFEKLQNAGHQIIFENPHGVAQRIIRNKKGQNGKKKKFSQN